MTALVYGQAASNRWPMTSRRQCTRLALACLCLTCLVCIFLLVRHGGSEGRSREFRELLPLIQLERAHVSRSQSFKHLRPVIEFFQTNNCSGPQVDSCASRDMLSLGHTLVDLGLPALSQTLRLAPSTPADQSQSRPSLQEMSDSILSKLCPTGSKSEDTSWQRRQADTGFCSRLTKYIKEIQDGARPPLLTLYTWLSDSMLDIPTAARNQLFDNWYLFQPLVQPVLFTDNRLHMFTAQVKGWPCLYIPGYNGDRLPIFKLMAKIVSKQFTSTFYGYVSPLVYFDVSLLETLIKVEDVYLADPGKHQKGSSRSEKSPSSEPDSPQVIIHGDAVTANSIGKFSNLLDFSHIGQGKGQTEVKAGVYVVYTKHSWEQLPDIVADDTLVSSLLLSMPRSNDQVMINTSETILAVKAQVNKPLSDWGKQLPTAKPRDSSYNKRLVDQYLSSQSQRPGQGDRETRQIIATLFKNGSFLFNIKN